MLQTGAVDVPCGREAPREESAHRQFDAGRELIHFGLRRGGGGALDQTPRQVRCESLDEVELVLAQQAAAPEPDPGGVRGKQVRRVDVHEVRVVLPEGEEPRTVKAAVQILQEKLAHVVLVGNREKIEAVAKEQGVDVAGVPSVDPATSPKFEEYAQAYYEARKAKGVPSSRPASSSPTPSSTAR